VAPAELEVRSSRAVGLFALALGGLGLLAAAAWEPLRSPLHLFVFAALTAVGAWRGLDRRVRLRVSAEGIRYADWGPAVIPWHEFSGYAWRTWRGSPYLQLVPRRPSELVATFSPLGRLSHAAARLVRMPAVAIAVTPLHVSARELESAVAGHLPPVEPSGDLTNAASICYW
jgi:hypothetical protein